MSDCGAPAGLGVRSGCPRAVRRRFSALQDLHREAAGGLLGKPAVSAGPGGERPPFRSAGSARCSVRPRRGAVSPRPFLAPPEPTAAGGPRSSPQTPAPRAPPVITADCTYGPEPAGPRGNKERSRVRSAPAVPAGTRSAELCPPPGPGRAPSVRPTDRPRRTDGCCGAPLLGGAGRLGCRRAAGTNNARRRPPALTARTDPARGSGRGRLRDRGTGRGAGAGKGLGAGTDRCHTAPAVRATVLSATGSRSAGRAGGCDPERCSARGSGR